MGCWHPILTLNQGHVGSNPTRDAMEKTINSIRFVPLSQMTEDDWDILDWDMLRNKAKNRIAATIVAGTLKGFYHVNVLMKARAKPDYYWPAEFGDRGSLDSDTADFFRYEADDEFESDDVENVDQMILENSLLPARHLQLLLASLSAWVLTHDEVLDEDAERIEDLKDAAEQSDRLSTHDHMVLAVYLFRWWGTLEWERKLEQIDRREQLREEREDFGRN